MAYRNKVHVALAALIMLLGTGLRVYLLDASHVHKDHAFLLRESMRWVNTGILPASSSQSSIGFINPPGVQWLYGLPLWVWPDVIAVAWLTMLIGLLGIAATGYIAWRLFDSTVALWSMALFAVNPWMVVYSRELWQPSLIPTFATLAFGGLALYIAWQPRGYFLVISALATAFMTQFHLGAAIQLVTIALIGILFCRRLRIGPVVLGIGLFLLTYLPWIQLQLQKNWSDLKILRDAAGDSAEFSLASLYISLDVLRFKALMPDSDLALPDRFATILAAAALVTTIILLLNRQRQSKQNTAATTERDALLILLIWFAVPIIYYSRTTTYLQLWYLMAQLPAQFLGLGLLLGTVQKHIASRNTATERTLFTAIGLLPAVVWMAWQVGFSAVHTTAFANGMSGGLLLSDYRGAITQARTLLQEDPSCRLVVLTPSEGYPVETGDLSLLKEFVDPDRVTLVDGNLAAVLPNSCAIYLDAHPGSRGSAWVQANASQLPDYGVERSAISWGFYQRSATKNTHSPLLTWDNGLELVAIERDALRPNQPLPLTLTFSVGKPVAQLGTRLHYTTQLLDENNTLYLQGDGPGFDSAEWRTDDQFVIWPTMMPNGTDLPTIPLKLMVAFYEAPSGPRATLVDGSDIGQIETVEVDTD